MASNDQNNKNQNDGEYSYEYSYDYRADDNNAYGSPNYRPPYVDPDKDGDRPAASEGWENIVSWIVIVGLLSTGVLSVVGIVLLVMKLKGRDVVAEIIDKIRVASKEAESASTGRRSSTTRPGAAAASAAASAASAAAAAASAAGKAWEETRQRERTKANQRNAAPNKRSAGKIKRISRGHVLLSLLGWMLMLGCGLTAAVLLYQWALYYTLCFGSVAVGGLGMIIGGHLMKKKEAEYRHYRNIVGDAGVMAMSRISEMKGDSYKETLKEITDMVERGYFGPQAYIDNGRGVLIIDREAASEEFARQRAAAEEQQKRAQAAARQSQMNEYEKRLAEMRAARDRILEPKMRAKVSHIEALSSSIFRAVEDKPEKRAQIRSFMDYYLPTAAKLFTTYAQFQEQGVEGENVRKAKKNIEDIADTLSAAFEKQLDSLYADEAMDVDTDIEVLEAMLRRDGLSGGGFPSGGAV